jgi:general stress protein 26
MEKPFWGTCDVKICCEGKGLAHCGKCPIFPCDMLKEYAYDKEQGDNGVSIEQCRIWRCEELKILERAREVINSKTDYIGDGIGGYAVMSLIDENGYPTSATMTISKADGINWISFLTDTSGVKTRRIAKSNKACICLPSSEYHISLVGIMEIITDPAIKKEHWQDVVTNHYKSDWNDPEWCVLMFKTERYNLFFASDDTEAKGTL